MFGTSPGETRHGMRRARPLMVASAQQHAPKLEAQSEIPSESVGGLTEAFTGALRPFD